MSRAFLMPVAIFVSCLGLAGSTARAQDASADRFKLLAHILKMDPKIVELPNIVNSYAAKLWCHELRTAKNEFERRDVISRVHQQMKQLLSTASPATFDLTTTYDLSQYNFQRQSYTIVLDRPNLFQKGRALYIGSIAFDKYRYCWNDQQFPFASEMDAVPDWSFLPVEIKVPEATARQWASSGTLTAHVALRFQPKRFTVEPSWNPRFMVSGDVTEWTLVIKDGQQAEVHRLGSKRAAATTGPTHTASAQPPAKVTPDTRTRGERLATRNVNIRSAPALTAKPVGMLTPPTQFDVDGKSEDGQWVRVSGTDGIKGWAHLATLMASSVDAVGSDVPAKDPALPAEQNVAMMVFGGIGAGPYKATYDIFNGNNVHVSTLTKNLKITQPAKCVFRLEHAEESASKLPNSFRLPLNFIRELDFNRVTGIAITREVHYNEALVSGPARKQRRAMLKVAIKGANAVCETRDGKRSCNADGHVGEGRGEYYILPRDVSEVQIRQAYVDLKANHCPGPR